MRVFHKTNAKKKEKNFKWPFWSGKNRIRNAFIIIFFLFTSSIFRSNFMQFLVSHLINKRKKKHEQFVLQVAPSIQFSFFIHFSETKSFLHWDVQNFTHKLDKLKFRHNFFFFFSSSLPSPSPVYISTILLLFILRDKKKK